MYQSKERMVSIFFITCVLYILGIKCNIFRIGQFLKKNYKIYMKENMLKVLDSNRILIIEAPISKNRTFKIVVNVFEHRCFARVASIEEWVRYYKLGHLIFKDLNSMQRNGMVSGLP